MRLLVISPTFPPTRSGGAGLIFALCERLADHGLEIEVVTTDIPGITQSGKFSIRAIMKHWSWAELPRIVRIARKFRPDVVEIEYAGSIYNHHPMVTLLPKALKVLAGNPRIVLRVEYPQPVYDCSASTLDRLANRAYRTFRRWRRIDQGYGPLLRDSDKVIVLCEPHVEMVAQHEVGVAAKCLVIPPSPSLAFSDNGPSRREEVKQAKLGISVDAMVIVYYGYIYPNKGIETLIEAFSLVIRQSCNVYLLIVGSTNEVVLQDYGRPDYLAELKQQAVELGAANKIIWSGYLPPDSAEASQLLSAGDICALPFDDGILMHRSSFAVAASHQLPVITTRGVKLETPFRDGENVVLVPPKDPAALAAAMEHLIRDPVLRGRLSRGARDLAQDHFSWDRCIEQTMHAFQRNGVATADAINRPDA